MQQINRATRIREVEEKIIIYIYGSSVKGYRVVSYET